MQVGVAGNLLNVCVCADCKTGLEKIMGFARAFPSAAKVSAAPAKTRKAAVVKTPAKKAAKFDRFALSEAEIERTQSLKPTVRMVDTPVNRERDSLDKLNSGQRSVQYGVASSPQHEMILLNKKLMPKAQAELGTMNVKLVAKRHDCEYVFEPA